jgi:hypothetical protein
MDNDNSFDGNCSKESIDELNVVKLIEPERFMMNYVNSNLIDEFDKNYKTKSNF